MLIKLVLSSRTWYARYTQAGSPDGYSEWVLLDRLDALGFLECGWSYEITEK